MTITSYKSSTAANPRQIQQRHILNMMGIECWVGRNTKTVHISDHNFAAHRQTSKQVINSPLASPENATTVTQQKNTLPANSAHQSAAKPSQVIKQAWSKFRQTAPSEPTTVAPAVVASVEKSIEAFTLLGIGFADWVLLVDSEQLHEGSTLPLWRNIVSSLSLTEQSLSFPICQGMQSVELANASLAGFVFSIAQDDNKRVAALTPLPEGLDHERLVSVPLLTEMLEDGRQKRQLWQLLSATSA